MSAAPALIVLSTLLAIGVATLVPSRTRATVVAAGSISASLVAGAMSISVERSGIPITVRTTKLLPSSGVLLRLDSLSALFVIVTSLIALAVAVYLVGYSKHHGLTRSGATSMLLFVTSMLLVPMAWNVVTFLVVWETMALSSLVLVLSDYRRSESVRSAGLWYAVLTQAGAALIATSLLVLAARAGSQDFSQIARHSGADGLALRGVAFLSLFVGFASKAGAVPFHVWLPKAHAEAPSPVSALMSAAMVNLGIYGILRSSLTLLGGGPAWWWTTVILVGAVSAIYGSVHAATSTDLKRLLAYSTTDNIGLILIAIGTTGLLQAQGHERFAVLALFAGLFHMVNHSLFKGTLFLSAGSIQYSTGTRNLDDLGGLLARMPIAGTIFAVGAGAIAALPPLGGFVSEWLLLQSLLHGLNSGSTASIVLMPLGVAALALTGGLTAAAFVKAFGVGFLGVPRSEAARNVVEPPTMMNLGALLLGSSCLVLGLAPMMVFAVVSDAVHGVIGSVPGAMDVHGVTVVVSSTRSAFSSSLLAGALVIAIVMTAGVRTLLARRYSIRRVVAWACGRESQTARMTYTATSFAEPLQRVFDDIIQPQNDVDVSHQSESRYYVDAVSYRTSDRDAFEQHVYRPLFASVEWMSSKVRLLQNGSVHRYLGYGLFTLVVLLLVTR